MNIEYTKQDIESLDKKRSEIHALTIIARNATEQALKLTHEISREHTKIATRFYQNRLNDPK